MQGSEEEEVQVQGSEVQEEVQEVVHEVQEVQEVVQEVQEEVQVVQDVHVATPQLRPPTCSFGLEAPQVDPSSYKYKT